MPALLFKKEVGGHVTSADQHTVFEILEKRSCSFDFLNSNWPPLHFYFKMGEYLELQAGQFSTQVCCLSFFCHFTLAFSLTLFCETSKQLPDKDITCIITWPYSLCACPVLSSTLIHLPPQRIHNLILKKREKKNTAGIKCKSLSDISYNIVCF